MVLKSLVAQLLIVNYLVVLSACSSTPTTPPRSSSLSPANFNLYFLQQTVADFTHWKEKYDANDSLRAAYGITHLKVAKILPDTGALVVINRFISLEQVQTFIASPALKNTMNNAGVTQLIGMDYIQVVRDDTSSMTSADRLLAKCTVNDFTKWITYFDQIGLPDKKENGLMTRGLGRGLLDTTQAYLVFAVLDKGKADNYFRSDAWKQFRQSSGIKSTPSILSYRYID